jgi:RimJ/RimL family protein N-acetyltransferase
MTRPALDAYVEWQLGATHPALRRWVGDAELRDGLLADLQETWSMRVDPAVLEQYAARCPVAGVEPSEYRLREIPLPGGASVLAGIHFVAMKVELPFVGVTAQSRALTRGEIAQASRLLCKELERFAPSRVRWWSAAHDDLREVPRSAGDRRVLVGSLREIAARPALALPPGFALEPDPATSCYEAYCDIYTRLHRDVPGSSATSRCEDREALQACAAAGTLFCLRDRGRLAGIIGARLDARYGAHTWYVVEEVLDAGYRGRGLAPALQRALIARLDPARASLILGEIDDANLPSLRTALRAGRLDAGGWVFLPA